MAAGQGYIEFATGDVLTAAAANGYLASQVVMVFANASARTSAITSPQEGMISYLKDTNAVEYYSGSAWSAVGGGGGGGGKVLQVVQASYSTETAIATTTYTDTGLSATITPTASTSKILIMTSQFVAVGRDTQQNDASARILRGATEIIDFKKVQGYYSASSLGSASDFDGRHSLVYLDSPATTSATTYKVQGKISYTANNGFSAWQGGGGSPATMTLMEIGA